jgi:hypothetical protein
LLQRTTHTLASSTSFTEPPAITSSNSSSTNQASATLPLASPVDFTEPPVITSSNSSSTNPATTEAIVVDLTTEVRVSENVSPQEISLFEDIND